MSVRTYSQAHKSTMTLDELSGMDSIVFQMHESDDVPGLLLKKGQHCTWIPAEPDLELKLNFCE